MMIVFKLALLLAVLLLSLARAESPDPPGGWNPPSGKIWCEFAQLPETLPFKFTQPIWWMEYFLYNATQNQTIEFKIYAGIQSDAYISMLIGTHYCPVLLNSAPAPGQNFSCPNAYTYGVANITINVTEGTQYVVFAHMSGGNYTVVACEDACSNFCPNDCNGYNGYCNVNTSKCICKPLWEGDDCSQLVANTTHTPKKKVPFGSVQVFYTFVVAIPSIIVISGVIGVALYAHHKRSAARKQKLPVNQPLLIDDPVVAQRSPSPGTNGTNGAHGSYDSAHSLNASPGLPGSPRGTQKYGLFTPYDNDASDD